MFFFLILEANLKCIVYEAANCYVTYYLMRVT